MCSVTEIGVSKYRQLTIIIIFKIFSMIKFKHRRLIYLKYEMWNILILLTSTKNSCAFLFKATQTWNFVYEFQ